MQTAIITGATGFVGVHLAQELLSKGISVNAICRKESPNIGRLPAGVNVIYDINESPRADVFYHLAWESASGPGRDDAALQAQNTQMTINALIAADKLGCKRFIALGTVSERLVPQILASGKFRGSDFYILSKDYARSVTCQLAYKLDMEFAWAAICHPIGRLIKPEQMMAFAVSNLLAGTSAPFGPATTPYDIVSVEDTAQGLRLLGQAELLSKRGYYIGSGAPKPLHEWLSDTQRILDADISLGIGQRPDDGFLFDEKWFDISPLTRDTGYRPLVSFEQSVQNVKAWIDGYAV